MRRVWMQYKKQKTENNSHHKGPEKGKEHKCFCFLSYNTRLQGASAELSVEQNQGVFWREDL